MIKKYIEKKLDWTKQVKLALFAYRCSHSNTGYFPFEVIYGRNLRGPLEILKDSWENTEKEKFDVCKWVEELRERLEVIKNCVREKEENSKKRMKDEYDKKAKVWELKEGSLVLLRVPGLNYKLDDSWDVPFEVFKKLSDVNYEVTVPNKRQEENSAMNN